MFFWFLIIIVFFSIIFRSFCYFLDRYMMIASELKIILPTIKLSFVHHILVFLELTYSCVNLLKILKSLSMRVLDFAGVQVVYSNYSYNSPALKYMLFPADQSCLVQNFLQIIQNFINPKCVHHSNSQKAQVSNISASDYFIQQPG